MSAVLRKETKTNLYLSRGEEGKFAISDKITPVYGEGDTEKEAAVDYWLSLSAYAALKAKEVKYGEWLNRNESTSEGE